VTVKDVGGNRDVIASCPSCVSWKGRGGGGRNEWEGEWEEVVQIQKHCVAQSRTHLPTQQIKPLPSLDPECNFFSKSILECA